MHTSWDILCTKKLEMIGNNRQNMEETAKNN